MPLPDDQPFSREPTTAEPPPALGPNATATPCNQPFAFVPPRRPAPRFGAWRIATLIGLAGVIFVLLGKPLVLVNQGTAQDPPPRTIADELEDASNPKPNAKSKASSAPASDKMPTLLDLFWASGTIGMVICLSSMVALGFVVEHAMTIRHVRLIPPDVVSELDRLISSGQIDSALDYVKQPEHDSLVSQVVRAGLERYRNSEFGFAEYRAAVEEAGEDYTSKLYRKTEALNVIGAIAPMLGLLGTVQGMIQAFNMIAARGGMARPDELAGAISLALVTTFEGLVVAIPAMVAFSYFRNRIDSLVAEAGKRVEQLLLPLGRQRGRGPGN